MINHPTKLIAVIDSAHFILYEAQGLKIINGPNNIDLPFAKHERGEKNHDSYNPVTGHNISGSTPQTSPKELDRQTMAKFISQHLEKIFAGKSDYKDLILVADPKMLGVVRENLSKQVKEKVATEIRKELVHENTQTIEQAVFG